MGDPDPPVGLLVSIVNSLYPSLCPSCGAESDTLATAPICSRCWSGITPYRGPSCRICSTPLASALARQCGDCMDEPPPFSRAVSFGLYGDTLALAINTFKFRGVRRMHRPLARLLLSCEMPEVDAVVPVPLHIRGLRDRGFNQSLLLARHVAAQKGLTLAMDVLIKQKETRPQVGLTAKERTRNLKGAFRATGDIGGMRILLIDDVITTGATARECAKELRRAGAADVLVLSLARAGEL